MIPFHPISRPGDLIVRRAIGQTAKVAPSPVPSQGPSSGLVYASVGMAAVLGLTASVLPKKQKKLKNFVFGGSLAAFALSGVLFALSK